MAFFSGRRSQFDQLRTDLLEQRTTTQAILHGEDGLGKTELARQYGAIHASDYGAGVKLVNCRGLKDVREAFARLALAMNVRYSGSEETNPDLRLFRIIAELEHLANAAPADKRRILVILDDANETEMIQPQMLQRLPAVDWLHLLITCPVLPNEAAAATVHRSLIEVGPLSLDESQQLIRAFQTGEEYLATIEQDVHALVQRLGGFTLAVEQSAVRLRESSTSQTAQELLQAVDQARFAENSSQKQSLAILEAVTRQTLSALTPQERFVIQCAAVLPAESIPVEWIEEQAWSKFPEFEKAVSPGEPDPWQELLKRLESLRLILSNDVTTDQDGGTLRMHRLMQRVIANWSGQQLHEFRASFIERAIREAKHLVEGGEESEDGDNHAAQLETVVNFAGDLLSNDVAEGAVLGTALGAMLPEIGRNREAEELLRRSLSLRQKENGFNDKDTLETASNLGILLLRTGRHEEGGKTLKQVLDALEKNPGEQFPTAGAAYGNLAALYANTRRFEDAEPLMRRSLALAEESFGASHPNVAVSLNNLAQLLRDTGRLNEAEPLMGRALAIAAQSFGEHPFVATCAGNLAQLLIAAGRLGEAEPLLRGALAIDEKLAGSNHPIVALRLNQLSQLLQATNRAEDAKPLSERAVAVLLEVSESTGQSHPFLPVAVKNYGTLLRRLGVSQDEVEQKLGQMGAQALDLWQRSGSE